MSKYASHAPEQHAGHPPEVTPPHGHGHEHGHGHAPQGGLPTWLWIAFAVVVIVGVIGIGGRQRFAENAAFEAMKTCEATAEDTTPRKQKLDGLNDYYPILHIAAQRDAVCDVFSQCDTQPLRGLKLFRKGLDAESNKSSRIVALACAVYLARAQTHPVAEFEPGVLEKEDFERILAHLDPAKESDVEVRRVALRALSDLTVLGDEKGVERYEKMPAGKDGTVKTHPDKLNGKNVVLVRWSTPEAALAWWAENAKPPAQWDAHAQRFTIP
jgi:hypothetical protein